MNIDGYVAQCESVTLNKLKINVIEYLLLYVLLMCGRMLLLLHMYQKCDLFVVGSILNHNINFVCFRTSTYYCTLYFCLGSTICDFIIMIVVTHDARRCRYAHFDYNTFTSSKDIYYHAQYIVYGTYDFMHPAFSDYIKVYIYLCISINETVSTL